MSNPLFEITDAGVTGHYTSTQDYVKGYRAFLTPILIDAGIDVVGVDDPTDMLNHHMNTDPEGRQARLARVWSLCWLIEFEPNAEQRGLMMFELGLAAAVLTSAHHIPAINTGSKVRKAGEAARDQHNRTRSYNVEQRRRVVAKILRDIPVPRGPITNRKIGLKKHVVKVLAEAQGIHISEQTARDDIASLKKSGVEPYKTA